MEVFGLGIKKNGSCYGVSKKNIRVDSHFGFCMFLAHVLVRFSNFVGTKKWSKKTARCNPSKYGMDLTYPPPRHAQYQLLCFEFLNLLLLCCMYWLLCAGHLESDFRLWWNHRRPTKKQQCTCWQFTTHCSIVPLLHCCVSVTFVSLGHLVGMR